MLKNIYCMQVCVCVQYCQPEQDRQPYIEEFWQYRAKKCMEDCVCVCICVYIYICMNTYAHVYEYVGMYMYRYERYMACSMVYTHEYTN